MIALGFTSTLENAADFNMNHGVSNTIKVSGCGVAQVGIIGIRNSVDGTHTLTSRCTGIETKSERDSIIQGYMKSGLCKGVTEDGNVAPL